jgi:predicted transcriptional regulator
MARKQLSELSPLELEVMNVIWALGECTSADVIKEFGKKRKLANTTIRTVLANIRKKGYLEAVPSVEPRIRFRPAVTRRTVKRRTVKQLLSDMFGDSPREAIEFLLKEEDIDENELGEIRRLLEEHPGGGEEE